MDNEIIDVPKKKYRGSRFLDIFFIICFISIFSYYFFSAPINNRSMANRQPTIVHIMPNESLTSISRQIENKGVVRYAYALRMFVTLFKSDRGIQRGDYLFKQNLPVWSIAWQLAQGRHDIDPIKITFKEGINTNQMALLLASKLSSFRKDLFLSDSKAKEGYLFPDTYFFFSMTTASEIINDLSANFNKQINPLLSEISSSGHTLSEIITMASIIEKEADGKDDAGLISGVLWKRLSINMLLQVDAVPSTYKIAGLPEYPINNPGLASIIAALRPIDSAYLFYLHDKTGKAHFAKTFTEHKQNITKYLR